MHHRELAREEAHVPRDAAALALRHGGIFNDTDCLELASHARVLHLRAGDTLFEEGRHEQRWCQLVRGELHLRRQPSGGAAPVVVGRVCARETFGESSFVLSRPNRYACVAAVDSVVCFLDGEAMRAACERRPLLASRFFRFVASQMTRELRKRGPLLVRFRNEFAGELDESGGAGEPAAASPVPSPTDLAHSGSKRRKSKTKQDA
jgi:CRP-like cAMP-binding protein